MDQGSELIKKPIYEFGSEYSDSDKNFKSNFDRFMEQNSGNMKKRTYME